MKELLLIYMPVNMNSQPTRIGVHGGNCGFFVLNGTSANVMLISLFIL